MCESKRASVIVAAIALGMVAGVSLACGESTTERLQEAGEQPTPTEVVIEPTALIEEDVEEEPEPTSPPSPTAAPVAEAEAMEIVAQGFGQEEQELGYAFLVENSNTGLALENAQYQVAVYDGGGTVIDTDSGYIELVLPGQTLALAGEMWLDEGVTVSELEVQLLQGDTIPTDPVAAFEVESAAYYTGDYSDAVTGIINSPYNIPLETIRVSAVPYNEAGEIIGGGYIYLNFILANGSTGVEVPVIAAGDVAAVELYPAVSGLTFLSKKPELPDGASDMVLTKEGFGQNDTEIGFGMLIENPNAGFGIEDSQYHVTVFSEDGHVLAVDEGYVEVLLPDQTLGVAGTVYLVADAEAARIEAQILPGDYVESDPIPAFTAEDVVYQADEWFPQVTGQVVSPYSEDITDVRVSVILYDDAGDIIGGGYGYLDFVPANGKAAAEVSVTSGGTPSTVELYASVSGLSEFK